MAKPIVWAVTAGFSQQPRSQPVIAVIGAAVSCRLWDAVVVVVRVGMPGASFPLTLLPLQAFLLTLAPAISYLAKFIRKAPGA